MILLVYTYTYTPGRFHDITHALTKVNRRSSKQNLRHIFFLYILHAHFSDTSYLLLVIECRVHGYSIRDPITVCKKNNNQDSIFMKDSDWEISVNNFQSWITYQYIFCYLYSSTRHLTRIGLMLAHSTMIPQKHFTENIPTFILDYWVAQIGFGYTEDF